MKKKRPIYALCSHSGSFSGARLAAASAVKALESRGWSVKRVNLPALRRDGQSRWKARIGFLWAFFVSWASAPAMAFRKRHAYLVLGQTTGAMFRAALPYLMATFWNHGSIRVMSLHGSLFTTWTTNRREAKLLRWYVRQSSYITILGPNHAKCLERLGIPKEKIRIVENTCDVKPLPDDQVDAKYDRLSSDQSPVRLLFLGNLIASKGYPTYLEALEILGKKQGGPRIEAVLCGPLEISAYDGRFRTAADAREWIERTVESINQSPGIRVEWIEGARGRDKENLLEQCHLFVFPSDYAVEAQPLVLLEAMASACAIITSDRGEIPITMEGRGVVLHDLSPKSVACQMEELASHPVALRQNAEELRQLFDRRFTFERHCDVWDGLYRGED